MKWLPKTLDKLSALCLYVRAIGDDFEVILPKYTISWIESDGVPLKCSLLSGLLSSMGHLPRVLSTGSMGELITAQTIAIRLHLSKTFSIAEV